MNVQSHLLLQGHPQRQKGVLLVIVLLVVALVSILATQTFARVSLDQRRSANIQHSTQAYYFALGAEELAMQILQQTMDGADQLDQAGDANKPSSNSLVLGGKGEKEGEGKGKSSGPETIHLGQPWASKGMVFPIDGGRLAGSITDMSACFNVNSLIDKPITAGGTINLTTDPNAPLILQPVLEELFRLVLEDSDATPQALAAALRDWLDQDQDPNGSDGAEDSVYQSRSPSYFAGNTLIGSIEELRTIEGFTPVLVEKIAPYLCALPDSKMKSLNVNTIKEEHADLVAMLFETTDQDKARDIISSRPENGYDQEGLNKAMEGLKVRKEAEGMLLVTSDRFLINAEAIVGRGHSRLQSLVRQGKEGDLEVVTRRFASNFGTNTSNTSETTQEDTDK